MNEWAVVLVFLCACGGVERSRSTPTAEKDRGKSGEAAPGEVQGRSDVLAGLQTRILKNGLKVLVKEDRNLPVVATALGYRVGSMHEPPEMTGLSHFLEHMLFKGTDRYKRGEIDRVTFEAGGNNNAWTSEDMTVYWFHVSSDRLEEFLALEANRMVRCLMDPMEFQNEKKVVLEELNRRLDSPGGPLHEEIEKVIFTRSGYDHPVLGWRDQLEKMTRDRMVEHYRTYYQPNNAVLVVVGDVDAKDCFEKAAKHFESIPAGPKAPLPRTKEPPQDRERRFQVETEDASSRLVMGFRSDVVGSKTDIALDLLSTILSNGKKSRLVARLVEKEDLVAEGGVGTTNNTRKYDGVFYAEAELKPGASVEAAEKAMLDELERLKNAPVAESELRRAKNLLRASFAFGKESTMGLAEAIVQFEVLDLPEYLRVYMDRVASITAAEIQAVARTVFDSQRRTVGTALAKPKKDGKNGRSGGHPGRVRCARSSGPAMQSAPELGEYWETRLRNGLTILAKRKPGVPVVAVRAHVRAGPLVEPNGQAGVAQLTGQLLDEGIRDDVGRRMLSHDQIASLVEDVGGVLSTGSTGVSVKVLSEHRGLAFDLVRDLLLFPSFPNDRFKKIRQDQLAEIQSADDEPRSVARRLFFETVFPGHPMRRPAFGYLDTVERLTRDDVLRHFGRFFRPDNAVLAVVGDIDPPTALQELARRFESWKGEGALDLPAISPAPRQTEPRSRYEFRRKKQVNVYLGHVGVERKNPDFAALRLLEFVLCKGSGFTDRMSMRVRDDAGLAYTVGGDITDGAGETPGAFLIYVGTQAGQKDEAVAMVLKELRAFIDEGPTDAELESAKKHLSRSVVFDWETAEEIAGGLVEMRRYNLPPDHLRGFVDAVRRMTKEEVRRVAQRYLDGKNVTIVVVGPVDKDGKIIKVEDK